MLTSEDRGVENVWAPDIGTDEVLDSTVRVRSDGSLYVADSYGAELATLTDPVVAVTEFPTLTDPAVGSCDNSEFGTWTDPVTDECQNPLTVELGEDGSLVVTSDGQVIGDPVFTPPDYSDIEFPLYHPVGESEELRIAIDKTEQAIDKLADQLRSGDPESESDATAMPADTGLITAMLADADLVDTENTSVLTDHYNQYLAQITAARSTLAQNDQGVESLTITTTDSVSDGLDQIGDTVAELRDQLKSASWMPLHSADGMIPPTTENTLLNAIISTLDDVQTTVVSVSDEMARIAEDVDEASPDDQNVDDDQDVDDTDYDGSLDGSGEESSAPIDTGDSSTTGTGTSATDATAGSGEAEVPDDETATQDTQTATQDTLPGVPDSDAALAEQADSAADTSLPVPDAITMPAADSTTAASTQDPISGLLASLAPMLMMMPMALAPLLPALLKALPGTTSATEDDQEEEPDNPQSPEMAAPAPPADVEAQTSEEATASPQAAAVPAPLPAASQMVDIRLPDGSTQKVTAPVAQAVNKEMSNPNGCDARAAYAGTSGQASAGTPWTAVDAADLRTGDVVQWANRSGIVVVDSTGVNVIVDGRPAPLDPQNPPPSGHGDYGAFLGFFHPTGADLSGGTTIGISTPAGAQPPVLRT
ncbi:hypothetical protein [Nocardia wallacei]|uniref:hypothetical protein n=1 Tax=Nocardia wallacei TaxID=480035 RepID=UPI002458C7CB|nr:hypothetical protein [Nocardia wallacei]